MLKRLGNHLPYFSAVAKNMSFSKAATELAVSQSAISYQIKCLEDKLGFKLFLRGQGSKVSLSDKGRTIYQQYLVFERSFNQVISDTQLNPDRTKLEITAPVDLGVKLLIPALSQLQPGDLIVNFDLTDKLINFKQSGFDFSVRNETEETDLEYLPLIAVKNVLMCSKRFAQENGVSTFSQINDQHRIIVRNSQKSNTWEKLFATHGRRFQQHQNKQVITNSFGIHRAIMESSGIGILSEYFIDVVNYDELYLFKETISETQFYLAFQSSYIAAKWAEVIRDKIIHDFENRRLSSDNCVN